MISERSVIMSDERGAEVNRNTVENGCDDEEKKAGLGKIGRAGDAASGTIRI
jgi:hypothetical protein